MAGGLGQILGKLSEKTVTKGLERLAEEVGVQFGQKTLEFLGAVAADALGNVMEEVVNAAAPVIEDAARTAAPYIKEAGIATGAAIARGGKYAIDKISEAELTRIGKETVKNLSGEAARKVAEAGLSAAEVGALVLFGVTQEAGGLVDRVKDRLKK